jgi:hypothetical protein
MPQSVCCIIDVTVMHVCAPAMSRFYFRSWTPMLKIVCLFVCDATPYYPPCLIAFSLFGLA